MKTLNALTVVDAVSIAMQLNFAVEMETEDVIASECYECEGHGEIECRTCDGYGRVETYYYDNDSESYEELGRMDCPNCGGSGNVECPTCEGDGGTKADPRFEWDEVKQEHCGSEMVTGKMDWTKWGMYRDDIDCDLEEFIETSRETGGHTHIDFTRFVREESADRVLANIAVMMEKLNNSIHAHVGTRSSRATNGYCDRYAEYELRESMSADRIVERYQRGQMTSNPRYRWINLSNVSNYPDAWKNTIEFRVYDATSEIETAERNIAFAQAFITYAYCVSPVVLKSLSVTDLYAELDELTERVLYAVLPDHYDEVTNESDQAILPYVEEIAGD